MLLIHKPRNHKLLILVITSICNIGALLGLSTLTYTPELSHADSINSNETRSLADITYMQEMNPQICANSPLNTQFTLTDSRDGETYTVARIKNQTNSEAYCWMTQNLRLTDYTLTPADSNVSKPYDLPTSVVLSATDNPKQFSENDIYESKVYYDPSHPEYGAYYNWYTATASTGNASITKPDINLQSSICPKGWKLSTGGGGGNFASLVSSLSTSSVLLAPYNFTINGRIQDSRNTNTDTGYYWSSTTPNAGYGMDAMYLYIGSNKVEANQSFTRHFGMNVRCVSAPASLTALSDATYMQELTSGMCERSAENESRQLIDTRDGKSYWVTKLKDGNCWMTQNLALDLDTTKPLTNIDSDISSSYTPSANTQQGTITKFPSSSDRTLSYNPGEYVYTTPTEQHSCGSSGITKLEGCPNWTLVTGLSKDTSGNEQAHYLAGNYYSYEVATAGYTSNSGSAPNSICPGNWTLPMSDSYESLFNSYGVNNGITYGNQAITDNPLSFIYGGYISNNSMAYTGSNGRYWSSIANSNTNAYRLYFSTSVTLSDTNLRYTGLSVRCVLRDNIPDYNNNVTIAVNPTISLDIANEVNVEKTETNPSTANLDVKVSSNQRYSVGISAANPNLTSSTNSTTIPAKSGLLNTADNGWGIKLKDDAEFTALISNLQTFYTASGAEIKTIPFTIGISTAPDIPNGEYSTDITITATQN